MNFFVECGINFIEIIEIPFEKRTTTYACKGGLLLLLNTSMSTTYNYCISVRVTQYIKAILSKSQIERESDYNYDDFFLFKGRPRTTRFLVCDALWLPPTAPLPPPPRRRSNHVVYWVTLCDSVGHDSKNGGIAYSRNWKRKRL